jgi:hypothetical protein
MIFEADEIKERDVDSFLRSKLVHQLNVNVREYVATSVVADVKCFIPDIV